MLFQNGMNTTYIAQRPSSCQIWGMMQPMVIKSVPTPALYDVVQLLRNFPHYCVILSFVRSYILSCSFIRIYHRYNVVPSKNQLPWSGRFRPSTQSPRRKRKAAKIRKNYDNITRWIVQTVNIMTQRNKISNQNDTAKGRDGIDLYICTYATRERR